MKLIHLMLVCALGTLSGCATANHTMINGAKSSPPRTAPENIAVYTAPPERPHDVVALLESGALEDSYLSVSRASSAAIGALKDEASEIGADAILLHSKSVGNAHAIMSSNSFGTANFNTTGTAYGNGLGGVNYNSNTYGTTSNSGFGVVQQTKRVDFQAVAIRFR